MRPPGLIRGGFDPLGCLTIALFLALVTLVGIALVVLLLLNGC